ncbi:SCO family protein [Saprospira sp. CCB-QB6]|uniref:SCO family protein n=1 Tax=Saprospira sp. CCB-QB6 TaxID=3023936 RepID=UPI00234BA61C|nr:SCO family protein [Saprospira sp. CCB-QB6]WCL80588.1 SCO family protein [Saprospira sp. CCB-QB6]
MNTKLFIFLLALGCFGACSSNPQKILPVLGQPEVTEKVVDGKTVYDSTEHKISDFSLYNQEGENITQATVEGKVYVADFFFTSCPTICPKVKANLKKVYKEYKDRDDFLLLSHSIDVKHDTIGRLAWYADKFNIDAKSWHLLTGKHADIYKLSPQYLIAALVDEGAPGGFDHSGAVALVDRHRRIRGMYDGTDPEKMEDLIKDIAILLAEK